MNSICPMNFFRTTDTTDTTIWKPGLMGKQCKGDDASQVPFFVILFFVLDRNVPMDWPIHVIAFTGSFQTSKSGSFYVHCA